MIVTVIVFCYMHRLFTVEECFEVDGTLAEAVPELSGNENMHM